ncbi:protein PTHB1 isoform X2 [Polypterus senegalus]|uniref:protein PTHB1 isoform X2 n=1 Tax=Polypterus senegalus TaxID=55291 RepID=UPI00196668EF|nr:protein PTHB1 isoform X2 [Polypterus senegalus]
MSLFKAREWWSATLGHDEEFDQGCLCIADIDNSGKGQDKIIVGSYMGFLRIFSPHPSKHGESMVPQDQMLEVQLKDSIIQIEVGKYVSGTELLHLAVLHPRKLAVFSVFGIAGTVEHGNQYQLRLVYEHNLQRTACNMVSGPFGGVKGRDFICIQSMDGILMFFEQESYSFSRFLPGFLLPGPLSYNPRTDAFITVSSLRQVENYKYQTLAVATDVDCRAEAEQQKLGSGKRLTADWTLMIGEQAVDICILSSAQAASFVFVLGERNFFCIKANGQMRFMKKLEYNPSCFLPYASVIEGTINSLVGNHNNMLLVYQDVTLRWAAQLPHVPIALRVANFQDLKGVIVTLSSSGNLQCSYLGTDPALFQAPRVEARDINYEELDVEMKELQQIIREMAKTQDVLPKISKEEDLSVTAITYPNLDTELAAYSKIGSEKSPSITVKVQLKSRVAVLNLKLSVCVLPPLAASPEQVVLDSLGPGSSSAVTFHVFLTGSFSPAELEGDVAVSYTTATELNPYGVPRVAQCKFILPLKLVCSPTPPSKSVTCRITIDTNKPPVSLQDIFPDFVEKTEEEQVHAIGFQLVSGSRVTVLASKTSQRYRIQGEVFEDLWLITKELVERFEKHFANQGAKDFQCSFTGPIPLAEYYEVIDRHFELRLNAEKYQNFLAERAVQFRAIQRRLLTRFKDKTPAPLQNLDTLMDATYRQVIVLGDAAEENESALCQAFTRLKSATHLFLLLLRLWQSLNKEQMDILEATFLPLLQDTSQLGWEECVDAAVTHHLRTCLSRSPKEQALNLTSQLALPKDTVRLRKHISLLCDRMAKGGRLCLSAEGNAPIPVIMPGGCEPIPESDLEDSAGELESLAEISSQRHHIRMADKPD